MVTFHLLVKDRRYFGFDEVVDTFDATFIGCFVKYFGQVPRRSNYFCL